MGGKAKKNKRVDKDGILLMDPPRTVGNKEHFQRINYLFQVSTWQTINLNSHDLDQGMARMYAKNLDLIGKKTKSSLLPQIKRTCCKKCYRVLIPKRTVHSKINERDALELHCRCGHTKTFPIGINRDYKNFYEKPGNLLSLD